MLTQEEIARLENLIGKPITDAVIKATMLAETAGKERCGSTEKDLLVDLFNILCMINQNLFALTCMFALSHPDPEIHELGKLVQSGALPGTKTKVEHE